MWHEGVQAGWHSRGIKMREWERGKQMSDSPPHPSALALSCIKPARLEKEGKATIAVGILR